jgi:hypothetical protein
MWTRTGTVSASQIERFAQCFGQLQGGLEASLGLARKRSPPPPVDRGGKDQTTRPASCLSERMVPHPVQLEVASPTSFKRIHLVIRLVLLTALGAIGCSSLYWVLYLSLPALAAVPILQKGGGRYLSDDGPVISRALGWLAAVYAYLWLLTDTIPSPGTPSSVTLRIQSQGEPTAGSALRRLITSAPGLILLVLLSFLGFAVWVVCAASILLLETSPAALREFLRLTLSYQFRLVAYHVSLVDRYPSLDDAIAPAARGSWPA